MMMNENSHDNKSKLTRAIGIGKHKHFLFMKGLDLILARKKKTPWETSHKLYF